MPNLYDISGSANFANKADLGVVVHRVTEANPPRTEIHVRKCRFKSVGRIGSATLTYDPATGRYSGCPEPSSFHDGAGNGREGGGQRRWGGDN